MFWDFDSDTGFENALSSPSHRREEGIQGSTEKERLRDTDDCVERLAVGTDGLQDSLILEVFEQTLAIFTLVRGQLQPRVLAPVPAGYCQSKETTI